MQNVRRVIKNEAQTEMAPWFRNFEGSVERKGASKFLVYGNAVKTGNNTVEVTELPAGRWTQEFKEQLEKWVADRANHPLGLQDFQEYHTDTIVHFLRT